MNRRKQLTDLPETWKPVEDVSHRTRCFHFKLITPMIGGDVESWQLNTKAPVRSQSVKGQLRFWWRTMQTTEDCTELLHRENSIWGGMHGKDEHGQELHRKSQVQIAVVNQEPGKAQKGDDAKTFARIVPGYISWPMFQGNQGPTPSALPGLSFKLAVTYPLKLEGEIFNTLKLWCLFGGVGARTRRGTGSMRCDALLADFQTPEDITTFVKSLWTKGVPDKHSSPYPILANSLLGICTPESAGSPTHLWHELIKSYAAYRQGPGIGRGEGSKGRPGRSYWPEPDAIRHISGRPDSRHQPEHPDGKWFPRAAYGLPLFFRFKDHDDPGGKEGVQLSPTEKDRWPSPVILKVIQLPNQSVLQVGLVLNQAVPPNLQLSNLGGNDYTLDTEERPLSCRDKIMKKNDPLQYMGQSPYDHLLAHLNLEMQS